MDRTQPRAPLHLAEYASEAAALGLFMVSAAVVTMLLEHPQSPVREAIASPLGRRALVGAGMGLTAMCLIYSPLGGRSGAHMNPAVTLTFWRLGKLGGADAAAYIAAQFAGAALALGAVAWAAGPWLSDPAVDYVATRPGPAGPAAAFAAEAIISAGVIGLVLLTSSRPALMRYTGVLVGCLIALYITVEAPISGMSMNPARSTAPWLAGAAAVSPWIYFVAPALGMLGAGEWFVRTHGPQAVRCGKLNHPAEGPCIFRCAMHEETAAATAGAALGKEGLDVPTV